jgi:hypothetical protein
MLWSATFALPIGLRSALFWKTSRKSFSIRSERCVVIRPRTTTQPCEGHLVNPEGLLVELFVEARALNLLDTGEYLKLFANLAESQRLQMASLLDYAKKNRPVGTELIELIKGWHQPAAPAQPAPAIVD